MEPTSDDALLTAYLDGELSPQERKHLEERLVQEPELRRRLVLLEETWHCLDLLEQDNSNTEHIETTLHIAAVSVAELPFVPLKINHLGRWKIAALVGIVLFVVAFHFGTQPFLDDASFRRMLERYDMYIEISNDGFDFLQQLTDKRVFLPPLSDEMPSISANRAIYHQGEFDDPDLYRLLYRNYQKFRTLSSPVKRQQVHNLHRDIERAPGRVELVITLQNYYHWLKSLQSYENIELKRSQRLEKVANIIALKNRLDERQSYDAPLMPSEIISIEESKRLAEMLAELSPWQQERLLNNDPIQIINELKQTFSSAEELGDRW